VQNLDFRPREKKRTRERRATGQNPRKKTQTLPGNPLPSRLSWFLVSFFFLCRTSKKKIQTKKTSLEKSWLGFVAWFVAWFAAWFLGVEGGRVIF